MDEFWPDVGPNSAWRGGTGENWERGPYFLDGLLPLACQLDDDSLKAKVKPFLEWMLTHQAPNGMIGPANNDDWWPRMVAVKVFSQHFEVTGNPPMVTSIRQSLRRVRHLKRNSCLLSRKMSSYRRDKAGRA